MSATGRGRERNPLDFYQTPAWVTAALLQEAGVQTWIDRGKLALDPCAGHGAILKHLGPNAMGYEINTAAAAWGSSTGAFLPTQRIEVRDALEPKLWESSAPNEPRAPQLIVMNPPYSLAGELVERALAEIDITSWRDAADEQIPVVCALLRIGFMASKRRVAFHRKHPADIYVLSKRPSFTADGKTDASEYGWFCWPGNGRWFVCDPPTREQTARTNAEDANDKLDNARRAGDFNGGE